VLLLRCRFVFGKSKQPHAQKERGVVCLERGSNLAAELDRLDDARIVDVEGERSGFVIKCVTSASDTKLPLV